MSKTPIPKSRDYRTHHGDWLKACTIARDTAKTDEDAAYWQHQINTLNKISDSHALSHDAVAHLTENKTSEEDPFWCYIDSIASFTAMITALLAAGVLLTNQPAGAAGWGITAALLAFRGLKSAIEAQALSLKIKCNPSQALSGSK